MGGFSSVLTPGSDDSGANQGAAVLQNDGSASPVAPQQQAPTMPVPGSGQPQPQSAQPQPGTTLPNTSPLGPQAAAKVQAPASLDDIHLQMQELQSRIDQDRQTAQQLLQKALDPNAIFNYLPKQTASSMLQDALYNIAQRNMNTGAKPIQMQRLATALDLHKQQQSDLLTAYQGLKTSIGEQTAALGTQRALVGMQNQNAQVNAKLAEAQQREELRYNARMLTDQIQEYSARVKEASGKTKSDLEEALKTKAQQLTQIVSQLPDWEKPLYAVHMPAGMFPLTRTSQQEMGPNGEIRTVGTSVRQLPGMLAPTAGTAGATPTTTSGTPPTAVGAPTAVGGWTPINPKQIPGSKAIKDDQSQVNRYNTALGRMADVMDNVDILKSLPSALKVYMASEPGDFRSLIGRYDGLTEKQKQVAIDLNALREDVGLIRSGFNPGFRGDKAWAAMVNQVGNPLMDPSQMRGIMGTTMEAMLGMQAPAYQELARANGKRTAAPPREIWEHYGRAVGWDGQKGTLTAAQRVALKGKLASHGYDTTGL